MNKSQTELILNFQHIPSSIGKIRFYKQLESSMSAMKEIGFNDKQLKEITSLFTDTDISLVFLTFFVALFHVNVFFCQLNQINFIKQFILF